MDVTKYKNRRQKDQQNKTGEQLNKRNRKQNRNTDLTQRTNSGKRRQKQN